MTGSSFQVASTLPCQKCVFDTGARGIVIESDVGKEAFVVVNNGIVATDRPHQVLAERSHLGEAVAWAMAGGKQPRFMAKMSSV